MDFLRGKPEAGAIDVRLVREVEWRGAAICFLVFGCRCSHVGCFIGLHRLFTWWANGRMVNNLLGDNAKNKHIHDASTHFLVVDADDHVLQV